MLDENDKWSKKIKALSILIKILMSMHSPDPIKYNKMIKCELIDELKYSPLIIMYYS